MQEMQKMMSFIHSTTTLKKKLQRIWNTTPGWPRFVIRALSETAKNIGGKNKFQFLGFIHPLTPSHRVNR